ncbi:hypothetical protein FDUTEX481_04964 [Tolypothrix sp. PCC 7601]|nr:hypothetical protein FDUTEX481_04964 [Tolypothrix sp. PCC 7601]
MLVGCNPLQAIMSNKQLKPKISLRHVLFSNFTCNQMLRAQSLS